MIKVNESNTDRIIRAVAGVVLAVLYFANVVSGTLGVILLVVGAILLLTAATGFCPLYTLFKFSTKKS